MKPLFFLLALPFLTSLSTAMASTEIFSEGTAQGESLCASRVIHTYRPVIDQDQNVDKYKHCSMSCVLALHCGTAQAWGAGILKEFVDIFTPGDADVKDLKADGAGIRQVVRGYADRPQDCFNLCGRIYPSRRVKI